MPAPPLDLRKSARRRPRFGGLAEERDVPAPEKGTGPLRATPAPSPAPGALAAYGPLGRCAAPLSLGSTRRSARLGPGPSPSPRAPHASPLAGAAPQMRLREEEPRGPGSPRARARGGGGGRGDVRGGGGRAAAPKTRHGSRHQPGAGVGGVRGVPFPVSTSTHAPATRGRGRGWVSVASTLVPEPEGRLEIRSWLPRECKLLVQGHTARAAVARKPGTTGYKPVSRNLC